jgi:hypothetical protein
MCDGDLSEEQALKLASTTWPRGIVQLTHYSSSKKDNEDSKSNKQAHADYVYEKINQYGLEIDIEVESKMKEVSIFDYLDKFENDDLLCHYSGLPSIKIYENSLVQELTFVGVLKILPENYPAKRIANSHQFHKQIDPLGVWDLHFPRRGDPNIGRGVRKFGHPLLFLLGQEILLQLNLTLD